MGLVSYMILEVMVAGCVTALWLLVTLLHTSPYITTSRVGMGAGQALHVPLLSIWWLLKWPLAEPWDDREWSSASGVLSQELSPPFSESLPEHIAAWFWTTVWREVGARLTGSRTVESHLRITLVSLSGGSQDYPGVPRRWLSARCLVVAALFICEFRFIS